MKPSVQWLRHTVQALVLAFVFVAPVLAWYGSHLAGGGIDDLLADESGGFRQSVIASVDGIVRPPAEGAAGPLAPSERERIARERVNPVRGNTWSAQLFGVSLLDPLGGAEGMVSGKALWSALALALLIPVLLTAVLGRVFCSWLCPAGFLFEMSQKFGRLLTRIGLTSHNVSFWRGHKYVLLAVGLALTALVATPLLSAFYPPAMVARESHRVVFGFLGGGEASASMLLITGASVFLFGLLVVEMLVSQRLWCRYLCPGGALYSLIGRFRVLRVLRTASKCTSCADCVVACPMALNPMRDKMGLECDNCLACVSSCPEGALSLSVSLRDGPRRELLQPTVSASTRP